jgi:DNA repair exonuclease SbcCD nuclease subunit
MRVFPTMESLAERAVERVFLAGYDSASVEMMIVSDGTLAFTGQRNRQVCVVTGSACSRPNVARRGYDAGMVSFVHTADWQLGMTRHFLSQESQARFSEARIEAIRAIGRLALEEDCGFVVVGGDVFETNHVERQVIVRALDAMGATPDTTFYLLPGNHDPLDASSVFRSDTFARHVPDNVVVLDGEEPVDVGDGVRIVAAPWLSKKPLIDLVNQSITEASDHDGVTIVVGHGAVDELSPDPDDPAVIRLTDLEDAIGAGRVHYVALGDRHSTTDVGTTGRVWYSGAPEPTAFTEDDPGNALVVTLDGDEVAVASHPIGLWRYRSLDFDLQGPDDIGHLEETLMAIENKATTIVRLVLVGQLSLADKAHLDSVLEHHRDLFGSLNTWERHTDLVVLPDDADFTSLSLSGFAGDALTDLIEAATADGEQAATAMDALGLLYRLAGTTT